MATNGSALHTCNSIEKRKLEFYKSELGLMSSTEALLLAIESEQIAKNCGPFDPAYTLFSRQSRQFEDYALLLEKGGE